MSGVVVAGSINIDLVVRVPSLPRPGETVLGGRLLTIPGGKGANQAVAAARLGADVRMLGRVGADAFGPQLRDGLQREGIDVAGVAVDKTEPTGAALILVEEGGQNVITVAPGAGARLGEDELARLREVKAGDAVVLQCEIPMPFVDEAVSIARKAGATVVLNASPSAALAGRRLPSANVVVVNEAEARQLGEDALRRSADALVVTLGPAGAMVYEEGRHTRVDSYEVQVVDATAAGDALVGAVAYALARGGGVVEATRLGVAAGAAACTKMGAQPSLPTKEDLNRLFGVRA
jgi:ribokinase